MNEATAMSKPSPGSVGAGRSRARSAAPVVLLVACMVAVLYGNPTYFSNTLRSHHSHGTPPGAGIPEGDGHQSVTSGRSTVEREMETRGGGAVRATETLVLSHASIMEPLAEEEQLAEPLPPYRPAAGAAVVAFTARGENVEIVTSGGDKGGVQHPWNDNGARKVEDERRVRTLTVGGANVSALDEGGRGEGRWGDDEGAAATNIDHDGGGGLRGGELATAPAAARNELATADGAVVSPAADDSVRDAGGGGGGDAEQGGGGGGRVIEEGEGGKAGALMAGLSTNRSDGSSSEAAMPVVTSDEGDAEPDSTGLEVPGVEGGVIGVELAGLFASRSESDAFVAVPSPATVPVRAAAAASGTGEREEECGVNCSKHFEVRQEKRQMLEESNAPNMLLQPGKETNMQRQQELQEREKKSEKNASEGLWKRSKREDAPQMPPTIQKKAPEILLQKPGDANANLAQKADTGENPAQRQEHVGQEAEGVVEIGSDAEKDTDAMVKGTDTDMVKKEKAPLVVVAEAGGDGAEGGAVNNGAVRGSMQCASTKLGEGVGSIVNIATWKDVPGDAGYRSPFAEASAGRYVSQQKDVGGFNNIRLSLECGVAFAAATGRTFVIPPPVPISRMNNDVDKKEVDLRELFTFDKLRESGRVNVITTEEFLAIEAVSGGLGIQPGENVTQLDPLAVNEYMIQVARQYEGGLPEFELDQAAFVMPRRIGERVDLEDEKYAFAKTWLFERELLEYREKWAEAKVIHWRGKGARLLQPFYTFVLHGDEFADRYHKRLLRDLLHYPEEVYCKASQVISLLRQEDPSGDFSTFHVRRNDFKRAYKVVFMEIADVFANSADHLYNNEVVYVATDEKDKSLFEPFAKHVRVKFLSDYYERAGVSELDPNLLGMLDQVIASHGRTFTGCWLSTFTAYILRLRGHLQKPRTSNWSYFKPKKDYHHEYRLPKKPLWVTEWPLGWEGIDETGVPDAMAP